MITFNQATHEITANRLARDLAAIEGLMTAAAVLSPETSCVLLTNDYDLRHTDTLRNRTALLDCAHHAAWTQFLSEYAFYTMTEYRDYENAVKHYLFSDCTRRRYYADVSALVPFTEQNARAFFDAHIADTIERRTATVRNMLHHCGADYKKRPCVVSGRMTFRGYDAYDDASRVLAQFYRLACWLHGVEWSASIFNATIRNTRLVNGDTFKLVEDLPITVTLSANGNATVRIEDKKLITALNGALK